MGLIKKSGDGQRPEVQMLTAVTAKLQVQNLSASYISGKTPTLSAEIFGTGEAVG
ncbi:hypothetical protein [Paenibacillus sp. FSL M7-0896]|uniref:hypothetical protein n=1 Tax=Paenibacillus sp. FSL M7-0896 TaxID=2921610 RepID=UPI0030DC1DFB